MDNVDMETNDMTAEPENERFQELVKDVFGVLKALESEIVAYRAASVALLSHYDGDVAADAFQRALESARQSPASRKGLAGKYAVEAAQFEQLSHVPIGPKIGLLVEFLQAFRSGDVRLFPSNDAPLKDAK
jgi:hypothetical protein